MPQTKSSVLILGGGFTGLFTALHLSHQHYPLPIVAIDREWSFMFKPLLYEFLSGEMKSDLVWARYDDLLHNSGVAFIRDTIGAIDLPNRQVRLESGLSYTYEYLVLGLGSTTGYFGVEGAKEHSLPFRTGEDAIALGRHLRDCLQRATQTEDIEQRRALLTFAVLGAGRSGVELAATLADLLPDWYAQIGGNKQEIRVVIVQRGKEILKGDGEKLRSSANRALKQRAVPVELLLEAEITAVHPQRIEYKHGDRTQELSAATIIWTTGTTVNSLIQSLPIAPEYRDKQGRLMVTSTLQLPEYPEVFAGGDCAVCMENPLPATAQVAYQQAAAIAKNIMALSEGKPLTPAHVRLRGVLMKLGLDESVAEIFDRYEVKGKLGHFIRQGVYIEMLPTPVRNFKATTEWLTDEVFEQFVK